MGDGLMVRFASVVAALSGAVAMQRAVQRHNRDRRYGAGHPHRHVDG